jgi:predicted ribosomally synthesized peptide with nif11-like leader
MARFAPRPGSLLEKEFLMSKKEIDRFNAAVRKNPKWLEEIKKLGTNVDGIIAFAKEKGFKFTKADIEARVKEVKSKLSEKDLQKVAAGYGLGGEEGGAASAYLAVVGAVAVSGVVLVAGQVVAGVVAGTLSYTAR